MANATDVGTSLTKEEVVFALLSEREYQARRWGYRQDDGSFEEAPKSVNDYLVYMQHYLTKAFAEASEKPGNDAALEMLRKVVALGFACFEQNGVAVRDVDGVINARDGEPA